MGGGTGGGSDDRGSQAFDPARARAAFRALAVDARAPSAVAPVGTTQDRLLPATPDGLPVRIYRPETALPVATVVFLHGGGFVIGDLDTHDNHCRWLCSETGAVVVSVAYRRAPEHPFPAAVDDCLAAVRWAAAELDALGGRTGGLAIAGDSAGGCLAAVVTQLCRDSGGPELRAQLLVYPVADLRADGQYPSRAEYATGYLLTADAMRWFRACYLPDGTDPATPTASPIRGRLDGLPPAVVVTMEHDPLRDEGEAYAAALSAAGVRTRAHRFDGLIHGSFELPVLTEGCADAMREAFGSFRALLVDGIGDTR
ncbi:alpha/beta hydrolase [Actinomadura barringtoniae]|uniref:Alpha/beta hydrolase n=2 Tax=Actinomadura barringtoniae TaxID=1427535 RepID=A0A939PF50_9ACTN|nr:alpha/beta hydrolase [Actinomadura barringtoniae]